MSLPSALDFTNKIRTHATFVGVLFTLDSIFTIVLGACWDKIPKPPEHDESFKYIGKGLLYAGVICACFTTVYWIGFLKRVRFCITVCIVYIGIAVVLHLISLLGAILGLDLMLTFVMLIVCVLNAYIWIVLLQLRESLSNSSLSESGYA